jgi:hypothetical protein
MQVVGHGTRDVSTGRVTREVAAIQVADRWVELGWSIDAQRAERRPLSPSTTHGLAVSRHV